MLGGRWPDGLVLSPNKVAKKIGMSYTPVREAIIQLESEGLIEKVPNIGIRPKRLDRQDIEHLFETRMSIEGGAAWFAAEKISDDELNVLAGLLARQKATIRQFTATVASARTSVDRPTVWQDGPGAQFHVQLAQINFEFHVRLIASARNPRFMKITGDLHVLTALLRGHLIMPGDTPIGQHARAYHFHMRILDALKRHDAIAARDWVDNHILNARTHHLAVHDWQQQLSRHGTKLADEWPEALFATVEKIQSSINDANKSQEARETFE